MQPSWKQDEIFPIIVRLIEEASQQQAGFVESQAIAKQLAHDAEARPLIEDARKQSENEHSFDWLASNMVAWFGQRITVGESVWGRVIEREKVKGQWAYRATPNDRSR